MIPERKTSRKVSCRVEPWQVLRRPGHALDTAGAGPGHPHHVRCDPRCDVPRARRAMGFISSPLQLRRGPTGCLAMPNMTLRSIEAACLAIAAAYFHDRSGVFDDRSGVFQFYTDAKLPLLWLDLKDIKKIKVQNKHIYGCGNRLAVQSTRFIESPANSARKLVCLKQRNLVLFLLNGDIVT